MIVINITAIIFLLGLMATIMYTAYRAKQGKVPHIRKIPALDAIEEAVGRCAELGRPVYYPLGAAGFGDASTGGKMAALSLINYTAGLCAERGVKLLNGTIAPAIIPLIDDVVTQAYAMKGVPNLHQLTDIRYFPDQMAYVAGTDTIFKYEKPGAMIMIDTWWAEALAFCEIGKAAGAFQIGGTDYRPYMPYFIATCDYALIGEEIFVASAYVSKDPEPKATVLSEDIMKFVIIGVTLIFGLFAVAGLPWLVAYLSK
jgi:hypothetical protein